MVLQPAEQVVLYRDGDGGKAVLTLAVRLAMINAADSAHGDVLMKARAAFGGHRASFAYSAEIKPIFTAAPADKASCAFGSRCIALPGLLAIEQGDQIIDIPGGAVRSPYLAFPLTGWNCDGVDCGLFADFDHAASRLAGAPLEVQVTTSFFSDGERRLQCGAKRVDLAYLRSKGWVSMNCRTSEVRGDTWF